MILRGWQVLIDRLHTYTDHISYLLPGCAVLQHPAAALNGREDFKGDMERIPAIAFSSIKNYTSGTFIYINP